MITQVLAAIISTIAFSVLFGVPKQYYPYCGMIGGAGWLIYCLLDPWCSSPEGTLLATGVVVLLSRLFAVHMKCPVTIFLIAGIIPLVPGAGVYWTAYYIVTNQMELAADTGFTALKVAVAIVLGIVFIFQVPGQVFRIGMPKKGSGRK